MGGEMIAPSGEEAMAAACGKELGGGIKSVEVRRRGLCIRAQERVWARYKSRQEPAG